MWKTLTAVAPLALVAGLLTACSDSPTDSPYCEDLKADKAWFQSMSAADISRLDDAFSEMHHLAGEAPKAVAADWKTLDDGVTSVTDALDEAGISFDDLAAMQDGDVPEDIDLSALQQLTLKLESFGGAEMDKSAKVIERHAKDECGVTLTSG